MSSPISRRVFLTTWSGALIAIAAACQSQEVPVAPASTAAPAAAAPTAGPTSTSAPAAAATAAPAAAPTSAPAPAAAPTSAPAVSTNVARTDTLIMTVSDTFGQFQDATLANPFLRATQRTGWHFMFEPLFFWNPYWTSAVTWPAGLPNEPARIPWLAENATYNADSSQLTIKLRQGVTWSDGQPFTAQDVLFTLNMLKANSPDLLFAFDMLTWVKDVTAPDDLTAQITLNQPNPQFLGRYFSWFQDVGFPIVPQHIFQGQDQKTFTNLDLDKGWPVTTGPWKMVSSTPDQKIFARRDDWWGAKTGFRDVPKMKRVVVLPRMEDAKKVEVLVNNDVDTTHDLFPANIPALLQRDNKVMFWVDGNTQPYGSVSPSTIMIGFNNSKAPYDDVDIRRAINSALDRKQVSDVVYKGSGQVSVWPFALLPNLTPFADAAADLQTKYPVDAPDLDKTSQLMQSKGWQKDSEGFWSKDGQRFPMVVLLSPGFFQDIGPIFVSQWRKAGFDASFKSPTDFNTLTAQGNADVFIRFDNAIYQDPWVELEQYHSRYSAPTGQDAAQPYRWSNPDFDKYVDTMSQLQPNDPAFMTAFLGAMEIWLRELPALPTVKWYLRVPFNLTYWQGWPNEKNPYVCGGGWHRGAAGLLLHAVTPSTA
ncbi:MAG: ABC transporter substrate-binding protein [Chloroflexi bacterium]|nr:ABC transporter substrate-binding protein [Chloroflexota bacterium]